MMFRSEWRHERNKSVYSKLSLKELIRLSGTCKDARKDVWAYITDPTNLLNILNQSSPLEIQKFITNFFQSDSEHFKQLKQSVSIPALQKLSGNIAVRAPENAMCCYLMIANRSPEPSILDVNLAYLYAKERGYHKVADSLKIMKATAKFHDSGHVKDLSIPNNTFVNLSFTSLGFTDLVNSNSGTGNNELIGANLSGAFMEFAFLENCNLTGANLSGAILIDARITGANFTDVNFTQTRFFSFNKTNNNTRLNFQLTHWKNQLGDHPQENLMTAMVNDLIHIAKKLSVSEGIKFLEIAYQHPLFQPANFLTICKKTNLLFNFFSFKNEKNSNPMETVFQTTLAKAMKQIALPEQKNNSYFDLD